MEFVAAEAARPKRTRRARAIPCALRRLAGGQFPDEKLVSLTTAADLSIPCRATTRGECSTAARNRGSCWAQPPDESAATYDGILTSACYGSIARAASPRRKPMAGLRLFLPEGFAVVTAQRLRALSAAVGCRVVSIQDRHLECCAHRSPRSGERYDAACASARSGGAARASRSRDRANSPASLRTPSRPKPCRTRAKSSFDFAGLAFARWDPAGLRYGLNEPRELLTPHRDQDFTRLCETSKRIARRLLRRGKTPLYRAQPERWLEALVADDVSRVDARLDPRLRLFASDRGLRRPTAASWTC